MKKILYGAMSCLLLAACQGNYFEDAVKENLKDPDSAKFRNQHVSDKLGLACIEWSGKNSFGAYAGWNTAEFRKVAGSWEVVDFEASRDRCDAAYLEFQAEYLARRARASAAAAAAREVALELFAKGKNIPDADVTQALRESLKCRRLVDGYAYNAGEVAADTISEAARVLSEAGGEVPENWKQMLADAPSRENKEKMEQQREELLAGTC